MNARTLFNESRQAGLRGRHPRLGELAIGEIVERFIVAHVEDHVAQLQATLQGRAASD